MARDLLIELLGTTLRRPAHNCLRNRSVFPLSQQTHRFASNDTIAQKAHAPPAPLRSGIPPPRHAAPGSNIPLHLGIDRNPEALSAISRIPIPKRAKGETFTPSRLARPLGLPYPPAPGQNSPIDKRTWEERQKEYKDYDKVLERRKILARSYFRPYYQEWRSMDIHRGKSFVSNERLFKADKALYFPNMFGETLSEAGDGPDGGRDTTPGLLGKISVVGIQAGRWAEEQVDTFLSKKANPELHEIVARSGGLVQQAYINTQSGWAQSMLVKLFKSRIRSTVPAEEWDRYFIVKLARDTRKGLTEDIRDAMGFLNSQVGYVYLLDTECRIRWAGSGDAWDGENASLNAGIKRLLSQAQQGDLDNVPRPSVAGSSQPSGIELEKKTEEFERTAA